MKIGFLIIMFILGAAFGSFLCCQARRLRLKEEKGKRLGSRSVCNSCNRKLNWYENLPIISWLILRGRCRTCKKKIGLLELLSELGVAIAFLLLTVVFTSDSLNPIYSTTPVDPALAPFVGPSLASPNLLSFDPSNLTSVLTLLTFIATLLLTLSLAFLAIYDGAYGELPVKALTFSGICAILTIILKQWSLFSIFGFSSELIVEPLLAALLFGGLYYVLYKGSKGKWVGDGDWILAAIIGLALGSPWLALIALFLSNLSATLIMYPVVRKNKNHKIYFGPFLVLAFVVTYAFADFFNMYFVL
ncbi:MAG: prepilin peptidase [Candidatus Saccharibacteria bacterium]|nr:prepilin peptidase [Candidatus Saccharibacteria bacterium]